MWKVGRPTITAEDTFSICISRIKSADLKARRLDIVEFVAIARAMDAEPEALLKDVLVVLPDKPAI